MSFDLGMALAGALGGLGRGMVDVGQEQQRMDEQAQTQAMNEKAWEMRQQWLQDNSPAPTKTETVADPNNPGQNIVRNLQWEKAHPEDSEPAQWLVTSTANDPATMRIANKADQDAALLDFKRQQLQAAGENQAARLDIARERLGMEAERAANAKKGGAAGPTFADYANMTPDQQALYDKYRRGEVSPEEKAGAQADLKARERTLNEVGPDATPAEKANALYQNQVMMGAAPFGSVKSGASGGALSQLSTAQAAGPPANLAGAGGQSPHGAIVRTGTRKDGTRVAQYEDGTVAPI